MRLNEHTSGSSQPPHVSDSTVARASASAASSSTSEVSASCVWCSRLGVSVPLDSERCFALQREYGCHRCDRPGCWTHNPHCTFFGRERPEVADAPTTGTLAPDMFERTRVRITRQEHLQRVLVEWNEHSFIKGYASGAGFNCLIQTLRECLNDRCLHCVANVPWIRQELRKRFPTGENRVTEKNFLDLRNHWRSIVDLIGISARANGCDPAGHISAANFNVTAVLEDSRRVVEVDGEGPIPLFILNEGNAHFVPLLRNFS